MTQPTLTDRLAQRTRPTRAPVMYQTWRHLLFLHWALPPERIQRTLPPDLTVDTFDGQAYLGVVPFFMHAVRPRLAPALPRISYFQEANVRTYVVDANGVPGVWFYSLDAAQWLAVAVARALYRLPYFWATMAADVAPDGTVDYRSRRRGTAETTRFIYRGEGEAVSAEPGTLTFFLVERYVLFAQTRRGVASGRVYHTPYPVQAATVTAWDDTLARLAGFTEPTRPPDSIFYSAGVTVDIFPLVN